MKQFLLLADCSHLTLDPRPRAVPCHRPNAALPIALLLTRLYLHRRDDGSASPSGSEGSFDAAVGPSGLLAAVVSAAPNVDTSGLALLDQKAVAMAGSQRCVYREILFTTCDCFNACAGCLYTGTRMFVLGVALSVASTKCCLVLDRDVCTLHTRVFRLNQPLTVACRHPPAG